MKEAPFNEVAFMVERGSRVRREVGIPVGVSWNLGLPMVADQVIREELIDLVLLGRPALSNPHWPVWAARELAHNDPFSLIPRGLVMVATQSSGSRGVARLACRQQHRLVGGEKPSAATRLRGGGGQGARASFASRAR